MEIEVDRYTSKTKREKTDSDKRLCKKCAQGEAEDEKHVIMTCPKYENDRRKLVDYLTEAFPFFEQLDGQKKFIFIMQCYDWEATDALSRGLLLSVQKTRGSLGTVMGQMAVYTCMSLTKPLVTLLYTSFVLCTKHLMCICNITNSII